MNLQSEHYKHIFSRELKEFYHLELKFRLFIVIIAIILKSAIEIIIKHI